MRYIRVRLGRGREGRSGTGGRREAAMGCARCRRECALAGVSEGGKPRDARVTSVPERPLEFVSTASPSSACAQVAGSTSVTGLMTLKTLKSDVSDGFFAPDLKKQRRFTSVL